MLCPLHRRPNKPYYISSTLRSTQKARDAWLAHRGHGAIVMVSSQPSLKMLHVSTLGDDDTAGNLPEQLSSYRPIHSGTGAEPVRVIIT